MFETIAKQPAGNRRARWATVAISASVQSAVLVAFVIGTLYATDSLPTPRTMMVFVADAPIPPPPPAPVVAEVAPKPAAKPVVRPAEPARAVPVVATPVAAAPVEAPVGIAAETGLEAGAGTIVQAGFESGVTGGVVGGIAGGFDTEVAPPPTEPVRVGGSVSAPRLLVRVPPDYPAMAAAAQMEGRVILEATVDEKGSVDDVRVLRSHAIFDEAAIEALKQWRYEPLMFNGRPVPFVLTVTLSFNLNARPAR
jgi:periplasmic protein TonB